MSAVAEPASGAIKPRGLTTVRVICGVLVFACVGLTVALVLVAASASSHNASQAREIATLRSSLQAQVRTAQRDANAAMARANSVGDQGMTKLQDDLAGVRGTVTTLQGTTRSLSRKVTSLTNCLPEVQDEINGLSIDNSGFISTGTNVSRVCFKVVYPNTGGD